MGKNKDYLIVVLAVVAIISITVAVNAKAKLKAETSKMPAFARQVETLEAKLSTANSRCNQLEGALDAANRQVATAKKELENLKASMSSMVPAE